MFLELIWSCEGESYRHIRFFLLTATTSTITPSTGTVGGAGQIIRPNVDFCAQCTNNVACNNTEVSAFTNHLNIDM